MTAVDAAAATVHMVDRDDLTWTFRDEAPYYTIPGHHVRANLDPTPAYPHDPAEVEAALQHVLRRFPAPVPVDVYLLPCEETGRTNGFSYRWREFRADAGTPDRHSIVLSAKRIPIHPAVTRYVVAHEYGHHVQWWVQQALGIERPDAHAPDSQFTRDVYGPLRGIDGDDDPNPGRWHLAAGEVLADDFRVLVADVEVEFWPHSGVPRPETVDGLVGWWEHACDMNYAAVSRTPERDGG